MVSEVGWDGPLRMLAFDHRGVVKNAAGDRASDAKRLILDDEEECRRLVAEAHAGGRERVPVIVLGAGADAVTVERWLRVAARVAGYAGFAVGRTLWWDELRGWLDGDVDRGGAAERIGANYRRMLEAYIDSGFTAN